MMNSTKITKKLKKSKNKSLLLKKSQVFEKGKKTRKKKKNVILLVLPIEHGAVQGSGQGLFPSLLCPPLISRGVMA